MRSKAHNGSRRGHQTSSVQDSLRTGSDYQTIQNLSTRHEPTHMLGDYNSVQVLPIIGKEVNVEPSEPYRKVASRVELTKRDM